MTQMKRTITKEVYDRAVANKGYITSADQYEVFTVDEIYGYGVYCAKVEKEADQYIVNADFELSAKGVVNTGGGTVRGVPYGWSINKEFPGNSRGINSDGSNKHGDNSCWFWSKPMPSDFEFYQVVKDLPAGRYRLTCRLGCKSGCLGTLRMFVDQNVQYFGKETDYAQSVLTAGEHNTFAAHSAEKKRARFPWLLNRFVGCAARCPPPDCQVSFS